MEIGQHKCDNMARKLRLAQEILNIIYPVGSIYLSVNSTNPSSLFGGSWVQWGAGKVPVCVDTNDTDFNTVEKTGGEKTHTLTENELPSHDHNKATRWGTAGYIYGYTDTWQFTSEVKSSGKDLRTGKTGGDQAHNNLQPYITCFMWKRTA